MPLKSRNLRPHTTDARAHNHAKRLAEEWRAAGLVVDLVEYVDTATDPGGYVVTARSSTSIMSCRCQSWVVRTALWRRRALWTISVSVRPAGVEGDAASGRRPNRPVWRPPGNTSGLGKWSRTGSTAPAPYRPHWTRRWLFCPDG